MMKSACGLNVTRSPGNIVEDYSHAAIKRSLGKRVLPFFLRFRCIKPLASICTFMDKWTPLILSHILATAIVSTRGFERKLQPDGLRSYEMYGICAPVHSEIGR